MVQADVATSSMTTVAQVEYPPFALPAGGEVVEVADGVFWIRMPLPFALDHINLWLLHDGDGWVQVDTGLTADNVIAHWQTLMQDVIGTAPVKRLFVTHMHPDHVGLSGWLAGEWGAELHMSRGEYLSCRTVLSDSHKDAPSEALRFYQQAGFDEDALGLYRANFGGYGKFVGALPNAYVRLTDGMRVMIDGAEWQVLIGQGHSPEHVCLFCPAKGVLIAGDQLLPTISSNVSVWPIEPYANPLKEWLDSCRMLRSRLPEDVLVLPAHGKPFKGAHARLEQLIQGHERELQRLYEHCTTPRRIVDVFSVLFKNPVTKKTLLFATGEARAHLNYLLAEGKLQVETDATGVNHYRQC